MQIEYKNRQIERICTLASVAERKHGKRMAERSIKEWTKSRQPNPSR